ncbi:hypothetical protein [Citreimonas salinaria]|uniref:Uncharacterized protein n=1 Tax=Citreimonas salinaria TaxID=321339 RepID=A0A1H3KCU8_9RHOB|nr:hypothetical protein [Citreimonas salinaria]SDY49438.1 hypothetical protein SAMN05444340_10935 [Citreimonas salinaria]
MTSEVIIINKFGLALAADSAVTVEHVHNYERITKTYNSANKLFSLSKHAPVGVMLYNTVTLGGLPLETVIKNYREQLGRRKFGRLSEYADDFFGYLDGNSDLFPRQDTQFITALHLMDELLPILSSSTNKKDFKEKLEERVEEIESLDRIECLSDSQIASEVRASRSLLDDISNHIFRDRKSYATGTKSLVQKLYKTMFSRKYKTSGYTGLVFAGFGERDFLPSLSHYYVDCIFADKVRRWEIEEHSLSNTSQGQVIPLADSEVMETLLNGMNPQYEKEANSQTLTVLAKSIQTIIEQLPHADEAEKEKLKKASIKALIAGLDSYREAMKDYKDQHYSRPIRQAIAALPIAELGSVAETLINVSHIHKRVNPQFETVGGPVDVAVISKGDGFVWVKRKHYFDASINPTFALKYLG